jgi:hypothetical protein
LLGQAVPILQGIVESIGIFVLKLARMGGVQVNFEEAFAQAEKAALAAVRAASRLSAAARALAKAAAEGDIGRLRRAGERLSEEADSARQEAANACAAWTLDPETEERYLREEYADELLRSADASGLKMQRHDGTIISYPLIIRILPSQRAVALNRRRVSGLRPSKLAARLKASQNRVSRGNPQTFLETLFSAYKLVAQGERSRAAVSLEEIFRVLTLSPDSEYSRDDFARDLLSLDRSGTSVTRSGAQVSLPASTGTKDSRHTFVCATADGEIVTFYGIKFSEDVR